MKKGGKQDASRYSWAQPSQLQANSGAEKHKPWFPKLLELSLAKMGKQISKPVTTAQWKIPRWRCPGVNGHVNAGIQAPGDGGEEAHQRRLPGLDSVSARQEKAGRGQPGRGKDAGRTRLPVLAEARGKETAKGPWAWTVSQMW